MTIAWGIVGALSVTETVSWGILYYAFAVFLVLRPAPRRTTEREATATPSVAAGDALRSGPFWLLSTAFFLASVAAIAMMIHAIPFLLERGHSTSFAAFAVGLVGISQIPGRLLFAPAAGRLPRPIATSAVFVLIAAGIAMIVSVDATWAVLVGVVLLGMGNGMGTLARATAIADLYGPAAYGTIAGVAASMTTAARAGGPVAAALLAAAIGYVALLWTLVAIAAVAAAFAYRAETGAAYPSAPRPQEAYP